MPNLNLGWTDKKRRKDLPHSINFFFFFSYILFFFCPYFCILDFSRNPIPHHSSPCHTPATFGQNQIPTRGKTAVTTLHLQTPTPTLQRRRCHTPILTIFSAHLRRKPPPKILACHLRNGHELIRSQLTTMLNWPRKKSNESLLISVETYQQMK